MKRRYSFAALLLAGTMLAASTGFTQAHATDRLITRGKPVSYLPDETAPDYYEQEFEYGQSEGVDLLHFVNEFRTGPDAWAWSEDNTMKVRYSLNEVVYDSDMEGIAMIRAAEVSVNFSNIRPDGSDWNTCMSKGIESKAEVIAYGNGLSAEEVFNGWLNTELTYDFQFNRRKILGDFTTIGIGHVVRNGTDFWVMEFGTNTPNEVTPSFDGLMGVDFEIDPYLIMKKDVEAIPNVIELAPNDTSKLPFSVVHYLLQDTAGGVFSMLTYPEWTSDDPEICDIVDGQIVSKGKTGGATIKATTYGKTLEVTVKVMNPQVVDWEFKNGNWYAYIDGKMMTGWVLDGSAWYYMNDKGVMQNGWQKINNSWYYLGQSGAMVTGWVKEGKTYYYLDPITGIMKTGWVQDIDGWWYFMYGNGAMATGWLKLGNVWYYMYDSGVMATGWVYTGGNWYYMYENGAMATGWITDGQTGHFPDWYYLSGSGAMLSNCWIASGGNWYYLSGSGRALTNEVQKIGNEYYGFVGTGEMLTNSFAMTWGDTAFGSPYMSVGSITKQGIPLDGKVVAKNGKRYYDIYMFGNDGAAVKGWQYVAIDDDEDEGTPSTKKGWVFFGNDGLLKADCWEGDYFLMETGLMATDTWIGEWYVDSTGKWVPDKKK